MEAAKMQNQDVDEVMNFEIDGEDGFLEEMAKHKAILTAGIDKQRNLIDDVDFEDGWSVARANYFSWRGKALNESYQKYLTAAYQLECLRNAKAIAEADDSIEVVEFSGGYSGGQNVRVWCDHDNQYVALLA